MRTLGSAEREVENAASGTRYIARVLPYRSTDNFIAGAVVTFTDITRVTRAERAVRESEARLRFLADAGAALVSTLDYEAALRQVAALAVRSFTDVCFIDLTSEEGTLRRVAWAHRNAGKAIGMDEAALHAPSPNAQRHVATKVMRSGEPVFSAKVDDLWAQGVATNADDLAFLRMLNVHSIISVPLKVANDTIGALTIARSEDPAQAHSEADLQTALELGRRAGLAIEHARQHEVLRKRTIQQRVYLAELQHRVRNTLAVVRSIARRTAENSSSVEDYLAHFDGRLSAFARTQAEVTRDPTSGVMLEYLVAEELLAHGAREGEQVEISGPPIRLRDKAVELLGLAVHELATNAIKYGAFSQPQARVKIRWQVNGADGAQWLVLEWKEEGVQLDGEPVARRGFGTELLQRMLGYELGSEARLQHEKDGLRWIIRIPMNERLIHLAAAE
jgi:two-component system CheB/CheR fusion protein